MEAAGFETSADPVRFNTLRATAASVLGRLWITGYLLGPVFMDAWPNRALTLPLAALEHHTDTQTLIAELDQAGPVAGTPPCEAAAVARHPSQQEHPHIGPPHPQPGTPCSRGCAFGAPHGWPGPSPGGPSTPHAPVPRPRETGPFVNRGL